MHNVTRVRSRLALVASVSTALEVFVSESSRTRRPPEEQRSLLRAPWCEAQREGTMKRCSAAPPVVYGSAAFRVGYSNAIVRRMD